MQRLTGAFLVYLALMAMTVPALAAGRMLLQTFPTCGENFGCSRLNALHIRIPSV